MTKFGAVAILAIVGAVALATQSDFTANAMKTLSKYTHPHHYHHHAVAAAHKAVPAYGYAGPSRLAYGQADVGSCINGGYTTLGYVGCDPDPRIQFELNRDPSWARARSN